MWKYALIYNKEIEKCLGRLGGGGSVHVAAIILVINNSSYNLEQRSALIYQDVMH